MTIRQRGWVGWLAVLAIVVAWDVTVVTRGGQTMSSWWKTLPLWSRIIVAGYLLLHLQPELAPRGFSRFDILSRAADKVRS